MASSERLNLSGFMQYTISGRWFYDGPMRLCLSSSCRHEWPAFMRHVRLLAPPQTGLHDCDGTLPSRSHTPPAAHAGSPALCS